MTQNQSGQVLKKYGLYPSLEALCFIKVVASTQRVISFISEVAISYTGHFRAFQLNATVLRTKHQDDAVPLHPSDQ